MLLIVILTVVIFIFIPNQESHYLKPDADIIKKKSHTALIWTEIILFGTILLLLIRGFKKISEALYSIAGLGLFALGFFFLFDSIFLSATFLLNKLSIRQTFEKKYTVVYINYDQKDLLLRDDSLNKIIQGDKLLRQDNNYRIKISDTLTVSFSKGLLGFNCDPKIISR